MSNSLQQKSEGAGKHQSSKQQTDDSDNEEDWSSIVECVSLSSRLFFNLLAASLE